MSEKADNTNFWDIVRFSEECHDAHDPIELAAEDIRSVEAAQFALYGEIGSIVFNESTYEDVMSQIANEYYLSSSEVWTAAELAKDHLSEIRYYGEA